MFKKHFGKIPQMTQHGSWECDYTISSVVKQIQDWNSEFGVNLVPDFQRGDVWTEAQQIAYIEFILRGGPTAKVLYFNNPNWNRYEDGDDEMVCVDGLQRYRALEKFNNNKIKVFGAYFKDFGGSPRMANTIKINVNDLQTRAEVLQWYLDLNSGVSHTSEELERVRGLLDQAKYG